MECLPPECKRAKAGAARRGGGGSEWSDGVVEWWVAKFDHFTVGVAQKWEEWEECVAGFKHILMTPLIQHSIGVVCKGGLVRFIK
jgi:hypothetical protein